MKVKELEKSMKYLTDLKYRANLPGLVHDIKSWDMDSFDQRVYSSLRTYLKRINKFHIRCFRPSYFRHIVLKELDRRNYEFLRQSIILAFYVDKYRNKYTYDYLEIKNQFAIPQQDAQMMMWWMKLYKKREMESNDGEK